MWPLTIAWTVYVAGFIIATPYFEWRVAKDGGFVAWLFFGEFRAMGQAAIWPSYVWPHKQKEIPKSVVAFYRATNQKRKIDALPADNKAAMMLQAIAIMKESIEAGKDADRSELNAIYPGLGDHFLDDYLEASRLFVHAFEAQDNEALQQSQAATDRWEQWGRKNATQVLAKLSSLYGSMD